MMNRRSILLTAMAPAFAMLTACAASVQRTDPPGVAPSAPVPTGSAGLVTLNMVLDPQHPQDSGWQAFKQEWYEITKEQAQGRGMRFATQDGEPRSTGEAGTLMVVKVRDYRHVGIGARVFFGIMTGNAYINASVELRDLATGSVYGERAYNTSSSAGHGVLAAMTPKQIYAITDEVLTEIKGQ